MSDGKSFEIIVEKRGREALLKVFQHGLIVGDICDELQHLGVVEGVIVDEIRTIIANATIDRETVSSGVVAREKNTIYSITFGYETVELTEETIIVLGATYRNIYSMYYYEKESKSKGTFVEKGDIVCSISVKTVGVNIFGEPYEPLVYEGALPFNDIHDTIFRLDNENKIIYYADKSGYLAIDNVGKLCVIDPLKISDNLMELFYGFVPVWNSAILKKHYHTVYHSENKTVCQLGVEYDDQEIETWMNKENVYYGLIRKGIEPIYGKDASLKLFISSSAKPVVDEKGKVDLREFSPFVDVLEGTVIAEKIKAVEGHDGWNVFGDCIYAPHVKDLHFVAGDNITLSEDDEKIQYIATITGILMLESDYVAIKDCLIINGDVSSDTGNIHTEKNVFIKGNVTAGFTVETSGNILVTGVVEDYVHIKCKGSLKVNQGIFGKGGEVLVRGSCEIGFLQSTKIYCDGNVKVRDFVYDSKVFCGKILYIRGASLETNTKGAVLGGELIAMEGMVIHSVGTDAAITKLICGMNCNAADLLKEVKEKIIALNKRVTRLMYQSPINLKATNILEQLQKLSIEERREVKESLLQLKEVTQQQEMYQQKIPLLKEKIFHHSWEECHIEITGSVVPRTIVQIGNIRKVISDHDSCRDYYIADNVMHGRSIKSTS